MFLNIVSNAYKYSPSGGSVRIELQSPSAHDPNRFQVAITDQGIGMTPGQIERVFERFFRVDRSGQIPGSGLGMSIARAIIDLHQGDIVIRSQPGLGTTVIVSLHAATPGP